MAAVYILIFGEMAGFKIVLFIATHLKIEFYFSCSYEKFFSANQNSPICMKTTDGKLYSFVAIVLKLYRYIDHVLKLYKTQFSTICSLWFKDDLKLFVIPFPHNDTF